MKCSTPLALSELSCTSCGALQPLPTSLDAYDLLGIDMSSIGSNGWQVDLGDLKMLWRKRVALSHPDRMGGKDDVSGRVMGMGI
jgi:molecular chaperone HscB